MTSSGSSSITVTNNITATSVDPNAVSSAVVTAVKYGNAVMIGGRNVGITTE
jgi:hypothetical protein